MSEKRFFKELADFYAIATVDRLMSRKLHILYTVATEKTPTVDVIHEKTGVPISSIHRIIKRMREEDEVSLVYQRAKKEKGKELPIGKTGCYTVASWANINPSEFLDTFEDASKHLLKP